MVRAFVPSPARYDFGPPGWARRAGPDAQGCSNPLLRKVLKLIENKNIDTSQK
jgi:hypothetical protein